MIQLYSWKTPNGWKVSIALEELALPYVLHGVDISREDRPAEFLAASPNNKIPAITDEIASGETISIFESGAILVYLAEKTGKLLAPSGQARADALAWTFWQIGGIGPMLGQLGYFKMRAPETVPFAITRYTDEVARLLAVMETRLATNNYLAGEDYTIADIAVFPWILAARNFFKGEFENHFVDKPAIERWMTAISARPAVQRGLAIPA